MKESLLRIHVMPTQKIANISMYASMASNQGATAVNLAKHSMMSQSVVNGHAKSQNGKMAFI